MSSPPAPCGPAQLRAGRRDGVALAILLGLMLAQALWCVRVHRDFYRQHAPFYDSCSYTRQMADVASITGDAGVGAGIRHALSGNVALPFLQVVALSALVQPTRELGVWMQWIWLFALAMSSYWYLRRYRGLGATAALALTLPLISFDRIYDWHAGLPDFRMDLSLYILLALTAVWFLVSYETESRLPWLIAGIGAAAACLARATAPVYLVVMLGPLLAVRLWRQENRRRVLQGCAIMAGPVALAALMFLVYNFHFLYFYYVQFDNRHLTLWRGLAHFAFAATHIGPVMLIGSLAALALNLAAGWRWQWRDLDWRLVWLACAAPLFLAVLGAIWNPFISMPAVFGLLLFSYVPFRRGPALRGDRRMQAAVCALAVATALYCAVTAKSRHLLTGSSQTKMAAMKELIDRVSEEGARRGLRTVNYIAPAVGDLNPCALGNVLLYEYPAARVSLVFTDEARFTATNPDLWQHAVPGNSDAEKMDGLVETARAKADILILPTPAGIATLQRVHPDNLINFKTAELRQRMLAADEWQQVGSPVEIAPGEIYEVYRRRDAAQR